MAKHFGESSVLDNLGTESGTSRNVTRTASTFHFVVLVWGCLLAAGVMTAASSPLPRASGGSPEIILQLPAIGFSGDSGGGYCDSKANALFYTVGQGTYGSSLFMPVTLPNGAQVTGMVLYYYDKEPADQASGAAYLYKMTGSSFPQSYVYGPAVSGNDGYGAAGFVFDPPLTISNSDQYFVQVMLAACVGFKAVDLRYHLQIGPPPAKATFADVPPDYLYFRAIEALAGSGITSGCGAGNFCPDKNVTRGELAKFLAVGLGLHWPE